MSNSSSRSGSSKNAQRSTEDDMAYIKNFRKNLKTKPKKK